MKDKLLEIGLKAIRKAERFGADQAEAYLASYKSFSIHVENNAVKAASDKRDAGCGIRSIVGKGVGFSYVTNIQEEDILEAVERSVKLAKVSVPDPDFESLPADSASLPRISGLYDSAIHEIDSESSTELIMRMVDATKESLEGRNYAIEAEISVISAAKAIINSIGVSRSARTTYTSLYSFPTLKQGDDQTSSYEHQVVRNLKSVDPEWVGKKAAQNAISNLGARSIESGTMPVILAPLAVGVIIGNGLAAGVNAEEVQYSRSFLADSLGQNIATDELEIVDDALIDGAIGSRAFDAEGVVCQRTDLITSGILKSYLHNSYTANKSEVDNTGSASRPSYAGVPSISTSNLVVSPGSGKLDDLVSEIDRGILCRNTGDRPNTATGDLSALVSEGFYIERGEIKHPLRNTLIGINMRDLLSRIHRVGNDTEVRIEVISPSLVIDSVNVTSG